MESNDPFSLAPSNGARTKRDLYLSVTVAFILTLAVIFINGVVEYWNLHSLDELHGLVARSYVAERDLEIVLSSLKDAETGQRGYLLTGNKDYLAPYLAAAGLAGAPAYNKGAAQSIYTVIDRLEATFTRNNNTAALTQIPVMRALARDKFAELQRTIDLRMAGRTQEALAIVNGNSGKEIMDKMREVVARIGMSLDRLSQEREEKAKSASRLNVLLMEFAAGLSLVLLMTFWLTGRNALGRVRKSEASAVAKREWLRTALASIGDAVIATDTNGNVTLLNEVAEELTGWKIAEARGLPLKEVFRIINDHTRQPVENPVDKVLATGRIVGLANHTVLIARDGTERAIDDSASPIRAQDGSILGVILVFHDISARYAAEKAVAESEERLRTITNDARIGLVMVNAERRYVFANNAYANILGTGSEEIAGNELSTSLGPLYAEIRPYLDRAFAGERVTQELRVERSGQEERYFAFTYEPRRERGGVTCVIIVVSDISSTKRTETVLRDARDKAEAANRAKSEFLANISHEIRTPMNAVVGLSNILAMSKPLTDKQKEFVDTLKLSANSLLDLINDMLDIAKIETRNFDLEHIAFSFGDLVAEVKGVLSVKADEKGISLACEDSQLTRQRFLGDPLRIRQILTNLVSNAIKFTDTGGVSITLTGSAHPRPRHQSVKVTVKDSGIGIAPDKLTAIFDKFTQADTSTTRKYGGTGLGLAICKSLAELMGGSITVKSTPGEGSEFTLTLPLEQAGNAQAVPAETPETKDAVKRATPAQLLLVEDNAANILVAKHMIAELGYACDTAVNGQEALACLEKGKRGNYFAVLMDMQMPDMDGAEIMQRLREREKAEGGPTLPVIAMTAHALIGDREKFLNAGFDSYLSKPFRLHQLEAVLQRFDNS